MEQYLFMDIIIAYVLDLLLGDPYWLPHPVRYIGKLIQKTESILLGHVDRKRPPLCVSEPFDRRKRRAGVILTVIVVAVTFISVMLILELANYISPILFHVFNIFFIYTAIATRCLADEAKKVYRVIKANDFRLAREKLAMLVGRDTENLNEEEIVRGVVETTAENTVDGVISPLFYAMIGSLFGLAAPLAYAFKAISTLDSMVGYMNEKYIDFGRFSAKTDDAANYIPARLSGLLIPLAASFCGLSMKNSFSVMLRDRRKHKSPNCAYPEAAVAGALGVAIGGTNIYFGRKVEKPVIGEARRPLNSEDIIRTIRLMYATSFVTLLAGLIVIGIIIY